MLLEIKNLSASVNGEKLLRGIDLTIRRGETHVLMGPNGSGKTTLLNVLMGHPSYTVDEGEIYYEGEDLLSLSPDERARKGIFMSFQNPQEVPGLRVADFLRAAQGEREGKMPGVMRFHRELKSAMKDLKMDEAYADRYLNVGFSGGEKKKNEILQLNLLKPTLALLDETDSGLDVDAVKIVSDGVNKFRTEDRSVLIVTHHRAILGEIPVDKVHIIVAGRFVRSGGRELFDKVQSEGYSWLSGTNLGIDEESLRAADLDPQISEGSRAPR